MRNTTSFKNKTTFIKEIGRGAQGVVEKHLFNNQEVAIKKYFANSQGDIDAAALRELNIFQKLKNCPTINQLLDVDIVVLPSSIELQIMMPFHKYNLSQLSEMLPSNQKVNQLPLIMNQLFNALYNLYNAGIIHADIKPDNILADINDNKIKLALADFGLAVQLPCVFSYRHVRNPLRGSPLYIAPEILTGDVYYDEKIDIWSTAITILDFITEKYTTEPTDDQFEQADDAYEAIIYKIISISDDKPVEGGLTAPTLEIYKQIKTGKYHNHVNVQNLLSSYNIPPTIINALTTMLQINPADRIHIKNLYNGNLCTKEVILDRGEMKTNVKNYYFKVIYNLIKCCDNLNINPTTCYISIDLFERYLANFEVTTIDKSPEAMLKKLSLYAASCLILNHKLYETVEIDYDTIVIDFGYIFTVQELLFAQFYILKKFNYLLTTCDTDMFINALNIETSKSLKTFNFKNINLINVEKHLLDDFKESVIYNRIIYPSLLNMYKSIEKEGLYPGDMFSDELIEKFEG